MITRGRLLADAVTVSVLAVGIDRTWAQITALTATVLCVVVLLIGLAGSTRSGNYEVLAPARTAVLLVVLSASGPAMSIRRPAR